MKDVYIDCPIVENEKYKLRLISEEDRDDLLKVYSDKKAVSFFNSDNCGGDDFYITTKENMKGAIEGWLYCYKLKDFVRFSIVDKHKDEVVGTIELFHRDADDYFTNCGVLRLDIRSDYEKTEEIEKVLSLIIPSAYEWFKCTKIAIKAVPEAAERIKALTKLNFEATNEKFRGQDGTEYKSYFVLEK